MSSNLSEMFGGSAKAGNLSGLLPPRPRPGAAPPPSAPPPAPEPPEQFQDVPEDDEEPGPAAETAPAPSKTSAPKTSEPKTSAPYATRRAATAPAPPAPEPRRFDPAPSRGSGRALAEPAPARRETKPRVRDQATVGDAAGGPGRSKAPRRVRREPEMAPLPAMDDTTQVSVYLLPEAKAVAKRLRTDRGILNAEIVFDAIDATRGRLGQLVRAMQYEPRSDDSLFPARSTRRRARTRRQVGTPSRTLWTLQVTPAEHEVLDDLVQATGANGISQLISAAVEAYLLEESDERARS